MSGVGNPTTQRENTKGDEDIARYIVITCNSHKAEFYPSKFKKNGKSICKCIKYQGKWYNPLEFESTCGLNSRKWRQTIKHDGKPLGDLLSEGLSKPDGPQQDEHFSTSSMASAVKTPLSTHNAPSDTLTQDTGTLSPSMHACLTPQQTEELGSQVQTQVTPSQIPGFSDILQELEDRLKGSVITIMKEIVEKLRVAIESELSRLRDQLESVISKVNALEARVLVTNDITTPPATCTSSERNTNALSSKIAMVCEAIKSQQRELERRDRIERSKNVVIYGLKESDDQKPQIEIVQELFSSTLELPDIEVLRAIRLGKYRAEHRNPRPIRVFLSSARDKSAIMKNKKKLASTKIFINNDLTKEQSEREKKLRTVRKRMSQDPKYNAKHIYIYKSDLYLDRKLIDDITLREYGFDSSTPPPFRQ